VLEVLWRKIRLECVLTRYPQFTRTLGNGMWGLAAKTRTPGWLARLIRVHRFAGRRLGSEVPADLILLSVTDYMTKARLSNSLCSTGIEQPDISTRPTASWATSGEAP
jgi:hypothetical protein